MADRTIPRTCELCESPFIARAYDVRRGLGRFCSRTCSARNHTKYARVTRQCETCNTVLLVSSNAVERGLGKYCSVSCRIAGRRSDKRFWERVDRSPGYGPKGDCWLWIGSRSGTGYGRVLRISAHRRSWIIHNGPVADGLCVLHKCDNPPCVRPDHLFLGTNRDNNIDMVSKGRVRNGRTMLTPETVRAIRARGSKGVASKDIASEFHTSMSQVRKVITRRSWAHIV